MGVLFNAAIAIVLGILAVIVFLKLVLLATGLLTAAMPAIVTLWLMAMILKWMVRSLVK